MSYKVEDLKNRVDSSTSANYSEVITEHIHLDWTLDFEAKAVTGKATLIFKALVDGLEKIVLDAYTLNIQGDATLKVEGNTAQAPITVSKADFLFVSEKMEVVLPASLKEAVKVGSKITLEVSYSTTEASTALQWLSKDNTKGKKHPYLFTQCQAIHARTLLPCQDTPQVKATYTASVTAPAWATVLMSSLRRQSDIFSASQENPALLTTSVDEDKEVDTPVKTGDESTVSYFHQPIAIPSYLIALAAGAIAGKALSERVKIWAEPEVLESAHYEFHDTDRFIQLAEKITGLNYVWTRYDVLCLPPSFPYGGMENPCLTFATPTLLAGDRSLADVIAHEIAHSWSGNLVTNATWQHFWLNEGWTVWLERKISSAFHEDPDFENLSAMTGFNHLKDDVALNNKNGTGDFCRLVWPQAGHDPDDAFSSVPYEKGYSFLRFLEETVGSETFLVFVSKYFNAFKFSTVTTQEFIDFFLAFAKESASAEANAKLAETDWNNKFFANGLTENFSYANKLYTAVETFLKTVTSLLPEESLYYDEDKEDEIPAPSQAFVSALTTHRELNAQISGWNSAQICLLLEGLIEKNSQKAFSYEFFKLLEILLPKIAQSCNSEIKFRYLALTLTNDLFASASSYLAALDFIRAQGRMKFIRPLTRALAATQMGEDRIIADFEAHKSLYHPIARKMIAYDLKKWEEQAQQ